MKENQTENNFAELWQYVGKHKAPIETALRKFLPVAPPSIETKFNEAVEYALFPGGKRLRPVLTLLGAEVVGGSAEAVLPAAIAVEFIHSSSLIFDDLPCMDNAPERRGKTSVHEKYSEGLAILAALGLLNSSYGLVFVNHLDLPERAMQAHAEIVECIGASGMVGGQSLDLALAKGASSSDAVEQESTRNLKTSALMRLALRLGAILAGADYLQLSALSRFAELLGDAYQLGDDLLDLQEDGAIFEGQKPFALSYGTGTAQMRLKTLIDEAKRVLTENFAETEARNNLIQLTDYLAEKKILMTDEVQIDPEKLAEAYKYCREVTRLHAKSFYFAAKFLPRRKQLPIYALYALCRHVDDEVDEAEIKSEPEAVAAVERWKRKLNSVYSRAPNELLPEQSNKGQGTKDEGQTLVLYAWRDLLKNYEIPQNLPLELMKGVLMDTHVKRYETFEELYVYCYRVASTVGLMSSEIFGYREPATLEYAEALGIAMQLTNILRDVKEDALMNRIYLPQEDLRKFGVTEQQIFENRTDQNFVELMKFEIGRARDFYKKAEQGIPLLEKDTRFTVLLASGIYGRILDEIERQNHDVFASRAHTSTSQKLLLIPQIWLAAKRL